MTNHPPTKLKQLAIEAAKTGNWLTAIELNTALLQNNGLDANTYNRLGVAAAQLGKKKQASQYFRQALEIDKHNIIAKKHLARLSQHAPINPPTFIKQHFIEEPGKTKLVDLHRLASKTVLDSVVAGQAVELVRKKRYISVELSSQYLGALPEDISFRLCKLISRGNGYECFVRSVDHNSCCVYLREIKQSKRNAGIHSFPPGKNHCAADDFDEKMLIDDDLPTLKSGEEEETDLISPDNLE